MEECWFVLEEEDRVWWERRGRVERRESWDTTLGAGVR